MKVYNYGIVTRNSYCDGKKNVSKNQEKDHTIGLPSNVSLNHTFSQYYVIVDLE